MKDTTDIRCTYSGDRDEVLVAYLYDDIEPASRASFDAHLAACRRCQDELAALRGVRSQLGKWAPPEPMFATSHQPPAASHWWNAIPAWAQVAAAIRARFAGRGGAARRQRAAQRRSGTDQSDVGIVPAGHGRRGAAEQAESGLPRGARVADQIGGSRESDRINDGRRTGCGRDEHAGRGADCGGGRASGGRSATPVAIPNQPDGTDARRRRRTRSDGGA